MNLRALFAKVRAYWNAERPFSLGVILVSLLLVMMAYLPTLQSDYVPQDQWRAFRYSPLEQTSFERAEACVKLIPEYYVATGRPLIWMGECVEHAAVGKISDFARLRPFVLAIVLVTAIYLGVVLGEILGGVSVGIVASSAFLMAPGYSFMYLQGLPAGMVLISILLAAASFRRLKVLRDKGANPLSCIRRLWQPAVLFLSSCLIYPAWAFLVVPLALLEFGFNAQHTLSARIRKLVLTLAFYVCISAIYYFLVKISILILLRTTGYGNDLGAYDVSMQLNLTTVADRIVELARQFYAMPLLNYLSPPGMSVLLLALFSASAGWYAYKNAGKNILAATAFGGLVFLVGSVTLVAAISPWLFSHMDSLTTRHLIPWYVFFCATAVGLICSGAKKLAALYRDLPAMLAVLLVLIPAAAMQNKLSSLEVVTSGLELQYMRARVGTWLDEKGYYGDRYVHVVTPSVARLEYVESTLGAAYAGENATLSSSGNSVTISFMMNALLRERSDSPVGKSIEFVDCGSDQNCVNRVLAETNNVALGYTDGSAPIKSADNPFLINNSVLTSRPVHPVIERIFLPKVTATSQYVQYGPQGLFSASEPGWHAELQPKYPQALSVDFHESKSFSEIGLLSQDNLTVRAPKNIRINVSDDGKTWVTAATSEDSCAANTADGWHNVKFAQGVKARYLQIEIFSNCGDPGLLTLRGLRIQ